MNLTCPLILATAFVACGAASAQPPDEKNEPPFLAENLTLTVVRGYHTVAFDIDGRRLASVGVGNTTMIWEAGSGKELFTLAGNPKAEAFDVAFSPDGKWIATATRQGARVWNLATRTEAFTTRGQSWVDRVAFSPDSKRLATAGNPGLKVWDVTNGQAICTMPGDRTWESGVVFTPDGKQVVSCNMGKTVKLWDAATGKELRVFTGHTAPIYTVAISPDGQRIASASADKSVRVWNTTTGQVEHTLTGHGSKVNTVAFSPEGSILVSGGADKTIRLWDVVAGKEILSIPVPSEVYSAVVSPEGLRLAATGNDGVVRFWTIGTPLRPGEKLTADDLENAWTDLFGASALKRSRAILLLCSARDKAVPFLKGKLKPADVSAAEAKQFADLIRQLGNDNFTMRQRATASLEKLGKTAEPALRLALAHAVDAEGRRRIERLLYRLQSMTPSPEQARAEATAAVLERIASGEARALLEWLGGGAPEAWLTHEARASLQRLEARAAVP